MASSSTTQAHFGNNLQIPSTTPPSRPLHRRLEIDVVIAGVCQPSFGIEEKRMAVKGMKLKFITLVMKLSSPIACLEAADFNTTASKWEKAIILYVIGENPTLKYINTFIANKGLVHIHRKFLSQ